MIAEYRKLELLSKLRLVFTDLPMGEDGGSIFGMKSLAQEIQNRIEPLAKNPDEYKYLIDAASVMIIKSKGAEVQIIDTKNGDVLRKEDLVKKHGIFLKPKKNL